MLELHFLSLAFTFLRDTRDELKEVAYLCAPTGTPGQKYHQECPRDLQYFSPDSSIKEKLLQFAICEWKPQKKQIIQKKNSLWTGVHNLCCMINGGWREDHHAQNTVGLGDSEHCLDDHISVRWDWAKLLPAERQVLWLVFLQAYIQIQGEKYYTATSSLPPCPSLHVY